MRLMLRARNAHLRAGNRYRDAGRWASAAGAYRRHLGRRPNDVAIWVQLGHVEKELGRFEASEAAYRRATALAQDDPDPLLHLAHLLKRQGRTQDAFQTFQRLERIAPSVEVSDMLRSLGKLRRQRSVRITGAGAVLITVEDYLASLEGNIVAPGMTVLCSLVMAAAQAIDLEIHFIINDRNDGTEKPQFLAVDRGAMLEITRQMLGAHRDRRAVEAMIVDARSKAMPIAPGAGSLLVIVGPVWAAGNEISRFLAFGAQGTRIAAYIDDPGSFVDNPSAGDGWHGPWQALAELAHTADVLVVASDRERDRLLDLIGGSASNQVQVATLAAGRAVTLIERLRALTRAAGGRPRSGSGAAGAELIAVLRSIEGRCPVRRSIDAVALQEGVVFRPGAPARNVHGSAAYLANPLRLMFGAAFHRIDTDAAWMSGYEGGVVFRVSAGKEADVVILVALVIAPSAIGSAFSMSFVGSADHQRRWIILSGEQEFVRIEGRASDEGLCHLRLELRAEERSDDDDDDGELPYRADPRAVGVDGIGYYRPDRAGAARVLRERMVFA